MDTQVIELLGRNRLVSELLRAGLEVAIPARDRGIDLIAYLDLVDPPDEAKDLASAVAGPVQRFAAMPIQMKAASRQSFSISKKYAKLCDLILAFVWNLEDPDRAVTYALTYDEAVAIGDGLGWTTTSSWIDRHEYGTTRPSAELIERLAGFRMTPLKWRAKVTGTHQLPVEITGPAALRRPRR
jgi:hypothetical protein